MRYESDFYFNSSSEFESDDKMDSSGKTFDGRVIHVVSFLSDRFTAVGERESAGREMMEDWAVSPTAVKRTCSELHLLGATPLRVRQNRPAHFLSFTLIDPTHFARNKTQTLFVFGLSFS